MSYDDHTVKDLAQALGVCDADLDNASEGFLRVYEKFMSHDLDGEELVKDVAELKEVMATLDAVAEDNMAILIELMQRKAKERQLLVKALKLEAKEDSFLSVLVDLESLTLEPLTLKHEQQQLEAKKEMLVKIVAEFKELKTQVEAVAKAALERKALLEACKAEKRQVEAKINELKAKIEAKELKAKELADREKTETKAVIEEVTTMVEKTKDDQVCVTP